MSTQNHTEVVQDSSDCSRYRQPLSSELLGRKIKILYINL